MSWVVPLFLPSLRLYSLANCNNLQAPETRKVASSSRWPLEFLLQVCCIGIRERIVHVSRLCSRVSFLALSLFFFWFLLLLVAFSYVFVYFRPWRWLVPRVSVCMKSKWQFMGQWTLPYDNLWTVLCWTDIILYHVEGRYLILLLVH